MAKSVSTGSLKMQRDNFLLSTAYLAPIEYYVVLANSERILLEQHEYYQKQSYRNRCRIATANGIMDLSIPVDSAGKTLIRDLRISDHNNWQTHHWRSIETAYNSSPFFEYYADDFRPFFEKKWLFLWDFNLALFNKTLELLDIETKIELTEQYKPETSDNFLDLRAAIHPKKEISLLLKPYYQVFETKFGFMPNMSIIDLLFNMANEAQLILKK
jgi:hypothetical protein